MVAVFTGNGLGLFNASLVGAGAGSARSGQGTDRQYVNVANGNLVFQSQDEQLLFRGTALGSARTYNSLGTTAQVGADGWVTGFERRVELLQGQMGQAGSIMRRHTGDGGYQDFVYVAPNAYRSTAGEGAHDQLTLSPGTATWTYVEGTSRATETYASLADAQARGRLLSFSDGRSNAVSWVVDYDTQGRIVAIRDADSLASLRYTYDALGRLQQIEVHGEKPGQVSGRVNYGYDALGRLSWSLVDLTPESATDRAAWDAAGGNDGLLYRTSYAYQGDSLRVSLVRQSDGTLMSYGYDGQGRLVTATLGDDDANDADGVGQTVTYRYDTANRRTDVSDATGATWSYQFDAAGRLTRIELPARDGLRDVTKYAYDGDGNITQVATLRGAQTLQQTDFSYDAQGNVLWQWERATADGSARAIQRTYSASNQVTSETRHTGLDADGAGAAAAPTGGMTTVYLYDGQDRLRFVVSPTGDVHEYAYHAAGAGIGQVATERTYAEQRYDGAITLAAVATWASSRAGTAGSRVDFTYDAWGRLADRTDYARLDATGNGVPGEAAVNKRYTYDPQGRLLATLTLRGPTTARVQETENFRYDGLGRLLSEVRRSNTTLLSSSTWNYLDSGMSVRVTSGAAGAQRITTELRDQNGRTVSVTTSSGNAALSRTSRNYYDGYGRLRASEDAAGGRRYYFYDNQGQLLAEVGPTGTATSYERDAFGRIVATTTHATALNTASWFQAGAVNVSEWSTYRPVAQQNDRVARDEYDSAGLRVRSLDADGNQVVFRYDGAGQLVQATRLDAAGSADTARAIRYFHDANGRQVATLDAAGYLTEQVYDAAGRLVRTVAYATAATPSLRANGTLPELRPSTSAQDQTTRNFYDGLNRLVGVLDAEGYLSEVVYDSVNNVRATRSHARRLDALTGTEALQALLARVDGGGARETRITYDALGRAVREVNAEGTVTQYQYDTLGQLVATQVATGTTEIREGHLRYDALGNLIGELSGNGAPHLLPGMTEAQLDAVYAQYGVRHLYDALGLRTESIDSEGNRTWYFHDAAGRLTHTVRGTADAQGLANAAGEVSETRYDVFGQVIDSITYTGRLTIPNPGNRASVASAISTLQFVSGTDIRVQMEYNRLGQLTSTIDAQGNRRRYEYNAFGEQTFERLDLGQGQQRVAQSSYDARGKRIALVTGQGAVQTSQSWIHDAFGRIISSTDGRGQVRQWSYDRAGRQVSSWQTVNGVEQRQAQTYDAFDRVLSTTDAEGGVTTYRYDDATRTVTARSPEGLVITTVHGRHGQVISIADALGNTSRYEYDASGNQTAVVGADGTRQTQSFTTRNLVASTTDASGRSVVYTYDAAGRQLKRTVDPQGLNLTTRYGYDAAGRQLSVVDARGTETRNRFDANGNLVESILDPAGLALKTTYTWDAAGQQLSVTTGVGTAQSTTTTYAYDALGRRISQTVDAGQGRLNLVTQYRYDANGNVVARLDPAGRVTRFVYNADNRVELTIDPAGGVTRFWYDRAGHVLAQRRYATPIALSGLPETATAVQIQARLAADDARDVQVYSVYDRDGQLRLTINGVGAVSGYDRDASGRAVREIRYANTVVIAELRAALLSGDIDAAGVLSRLAVEPARDAVSWQVLDALGRVRFEVAADGSVMERRYDASGIQVATISYANRIDLTAQLRLDLASGRVGVQAIVAKLSASALDQSQYVVLDNAGRVRFEVRRDADGQGRITEYGYLGDDRVSTTAYGRAVVFDSQQTLAALQALVAPLRSAGEYRSERVVLDAAGRQRFAIDASGAVRETRFDTVGQVVASVTYRLQPGASDVQSLASLSAWAARQAADQQRLDTRGYDGAGRTVLHTNALGQVERFGYDAAGQLTSFTDTAGKVWTYTYNAAGLRTSETSPRVDVATVGTNGQFTLANRSLVTRTDYDALGNVMRRSEDADGGTPRVTEYQYDNRGNQVRVLFPDPWVLDEATGLLVASGQRTSVEVSYDALNRAVVQKDVRGTYTYKTYDVLGQLAYDVDGEGYVTSYSYDAYGNQTGLRRFATALRTAALAGWTPGKALGQLQLRDGGGLVASAADRQLLTSYNSLGQKVQTLSSTREYYAADGVARQGTPTVRYQYDGYGSLQRLSELLSGQADQADAQWAYTWHYYDALGRTVMTVDAEGYATSTLYTSTGEVATQTEYARALSTQSLGAQPPAAPSPGDAITGFDRRTSYTYDALGRKITQTATRQFQRADASAGQSDVQTRIAYDALGRVIQSSDENGTTTTSYDALGRVLSVREPERAALRANAEGQLDASVATDLSSSSMLERTSPYTTTVYDAFGNAVQMRRYANGWLAGQTAPVADDARDQLQRLQYDRQGRLVRATDALGNVQMYRYDAADKVVRTRQLLTGASAERNAVVISEFSYDRSGRQLSTSQKRVIGGIEQIDLSETVRYNGFGEIIGKTHGGLAGELLYGYDADGNMVQSNEGGTDVRLGYNLAGYQVRQSRSSWNGQAAVAAVTTIQTDRLGRALRTDMPSFSGNANAVSNVARQYDRWGNVTQIIDARGYQTNYQYNSFNQITRDERPLVEVVGETGARTWVRPVNEWFYDVFGRLVATRDANGHMRTSEYNAAGQLVKSRDAVGATTLYAYDALGNQRLQQNALGYVTFKQYDRLGRVTAIGDYLLNDAGTARYRTSLQQYRLNENGDRLAVTDALGYTALYDYDSRHLVVRSQTAMGVTQQYGYDVLGRKIVESNALSTALGADRDGQQVRLNELTWRYDIFGRTSDHNDLSARDFNYDYASSGQLAVQTGNGGQAADTTRTHQYYANGQLRRIEENGGNFTYYEYDAAGNRTLEEIYTRDGAGALVHTYTRTWYDSHNRIQRVVQDDASVGGNARRMFDIRYDYDAVGNRRRVLAQSSHGPNAAAMPVTNTAPTTVKTIADRTVRKGIQSQFNILFTDVFRDAEQDALTLDITQANGSPLPSWLGARYDAATGQIIFTAAPPADSGDADIAVKLTARETANAGNTVATVFTVRSRTNTGPRQLSPGVGLLNAKTGRAWAAELPAAMYFIDDDVGDVLSLSLENMASSLPSWLKVDLSNPSVLRLSGTPPVDASNLLRIRATDQSGAYSVKVVMLRGTANAGPNVVATPSLGEAIQGRSYSWSQPLSQLFVDPNGDPLQVRASGLPSWLNFTFLDGANPVLRLDGTVPSTVADGTTLAVTLTATDPDGQTSSVTLNLVVRANRAPVVLTPAGYQLQGIRVHDSLDVTLAISSLFTDLEGDRIAFEALKVPSWITATLDHSAGTIRLRGRAQQAGAVSLEVKGTDSAGLSSTAKVLLNIGQDRDPYRTPNVALNDISLSIGRNFSITLPDNLFTELDGDGYSIFMGVVEQGRYFLDDNNPRWINELVDKPWPSWMTFDAASRTLSGQVPPGTAMGNFTLVVNARDGRGNRSDPGGTIGAAGVSTDSFMRVNLVPFVNSPPVYTAGSMPPRTINHGTPVNFTMPPGAFVEPNGDALTYSAYVQLPDTWEYVRDPKNPSEFLPDPVRRDGPMADLSTVGLAINATTGTITGTPTNLAYLNYRIQVMARDPQGGIGFGKFDLNVLNAAPRAPTLSGQSAYAGAAWAYAIPAFQDANNETLTYTVSNRPAWMTFDAATRRLSGVPSAVGSWTVTITAKDAAGASASTTLTITTPNAGPVLANQVPQQWLWRNAAWSMQIPANTFTDPNGDPLSWSVSGLPSGLNFNAATRTIQGTTGTMGAFSITVSVNDGRGGSNATSFVINVGNAAPVYNGGLPSRNGQENEIVNWPLPSGTFTDPNNDGLRYSIMVEHPGYDEWFWDARDAAWASRWVEPKWQTSYQLTIDPATGTVSGPMPVFMKPVHPQTGTGGGYLPSFRVKIIATDGNASAEAVFGAYLNLKPVGSMGGRTIKAGVSTSVQVAPFSDANGDALTYSASGLPAGMSFDPANRTINGSAAAGTYAITIYANDGRGGVGTTTFTLIAQANNAPKAPAIGNLAMQVGTGVGVAMPAFPDPDGDPVAYHMTELPPGLWWDANSRVIGGTPSQAGSYLVRMGAADNRGGWSEVYFMIEVAPAPIPNRAPYVAVPPPSRAGHFQATNQYYVQPSGFTLPTNTFVDPDNNPLTYTIITKPAWLSYEYTANGHGFFGKSNDTRSYAVHTITIRATDPSGLYADVSFTVSSEYWGSTPGGGGTVPRSVPSPLNALAVSQASPPLVIGQPGRGGLIDTIGAGDIPPTEQPVQAPVPETSSSSPQTPTAAAALAAVSAWAGPVQIAGGSAPSGLGNVSSATGTGAVPVETKEYWYTYDGENRILVNNGSLQNGQIVLTLYGEDSYSLAYDAAGNVVSRTTNRSANGVSFHWIDRTSYDLRGNRQFEYFTDTIRNGIFESGGGVNKKLTYDAANHLTMSQSYYASGSVWEDKTGPGQEYETWGFYHYGGWLAGAETYAYDGDGRVTVQQTLYRNSGDWTWLKGADNTGGRQSTDLGVLQFQSGTDYSGGYDTLGRLVSYRYLTPQYTHTYTTRYEGRESWLQKSVTGTSTNSSYRTTTNTLSYDAFGRLMSQRETTPLKNGSIDDRMRYYANDMDGKVVNRREGTLTSNGTFSQAGVGGPGNFRLVQANGQQIAELKEGFQGVFANKPYTTTQIQSVAGRGRYDAGGGQTTAQAGDTLRTIAQRVYGTDQMWYVLADANGFGDADAEIGAGTRINTPEASVNRNDSGTFKPYDPTSAIGNTTPGLPYIPPPPPEKCGALSKVISIVVQVVVTAVVTYYSGNAEAGYAAGAAAGNHAGQVSAAMLNGRFDWSRWASMTANPFQGNANDAATTIFDPIGHGMPGQIDYKSIGVSAAASYTAAYLGGTNPYSYAATSYAANYQYAKWAGYDVSWSNRQLAQNLGSVAISQGLNKSGMFGTETRTGMDGNTNVVGQTAGAGSFSWSVAKNTALNFVAGAATYAAGKALGTGEHWNTGDALADAFGNALGSEIKGQYDQKAAIRRDGHMAARMLTEQGRVLEWGAGQDSTSLQPVRLQSQTAGEFSFAEVAVNSIPTANRARPNVVTLDTIHAVADPYAENGWYFYSWNKAGQKWVDPQKQIINPAVEKWSLPKHAWMSAYGASSSSSQGPGSWRMTGTRNGDYTLAGRLVSSYNVAQVSSGRAMTLSDLPQIEHLYTRRVGDWEAAYGEYMQGATDENMPSYMRLVGYIGAAATAIPMMFDTMASGLYNAGDDAALAGQYWGQAGMLSGHERNIAFLQGSLSFTMGFLGMGDVVTLGLGSRAAQIGSAYTDLTTVGPNIPARSGPTSGGETVTLYRVDDAGFAPRIGQDGSVPVVTTKSGNERALFINIGQPERAKEFALVNRGGNVKITAVEVDVSLLERLRAMSVYDRSPDVGLYPNAPLRVDINKAPDQFGLRTPEHFDWLRESIRPNTARVVDPKDL